MNTRSRAGGAPVAGWFPNTAAWTGRVLIVLLLIYSPWYFGMVTWGQQLLLLPWATAILICSGLTLISHPRTVPVLTPVHYGLLLLLLAASLQLIPLPDGLYEAVAPAASLEQQAVRQAADYLGISPDQPELLSAAANTGHRFTTLSIHPLQTRASLVGLTTAAIVLLCSSLLFSDKFSRNLLLIALCCVCTAFAILGILQNISWNNWSLLEMPRQGHFATFVSRNSAPQFLAIGIGSTIALMMSWVRKKRRQSRYQRRYRATTALARIRHALEDTVREIDAVSILLFVALIVQIVGVAGSGSRGGLVALFLALALTLLLTLSRNRGLVWTGLAFFGAMTLLSLVFLNALELDESIVHRLEVEGLESPQRVEFWKLALSQPEFWWTGCGLGNFHFALVPFNTEHPYWIYHAESVYVELITEYGWPIALLALGGLVWLFHQLVTRRRSGTVGSWPAALYAIIAIAVQSAVDFSLIIPAIFLGTAALVGAYLGETRRRELAEQPRRQRPGAVIGFSILSLALLGLLWQGAGPLAGFAQGEQIDWSMSAEDVGPLPDSDRWSTAHPEVVLQLSRRKVRLAENHLRQVTQWPDSITASQRAAFGRLELAAATLRSADRSRWQDLRQQWANDGQLLSAVEVSRQGFEYASRFCPYDWRGYWGLFQTATDPDPIVHALTCARLKRLTYSMPRMQQALATCSLIAGNRTVGLDLWKATLSVYPKLSFRLAPLVDNYLQPEELQELLPDSQISRALLAQALFRQDSTKEAGLKLLVDTDLAGLASEALTARDWDLVAWAAQQRGNETAAIEALLKLAAIKPMDKNVRVQLARAMESAGRLDEAIQQMEQAARRTTLSPTEQLYLLQLRQKLNAPPNGQ